MKRNWSFFAAASVLGGYLLLAAGAPPIAVGAGIGLGAIMTHRVTRP